ncbi:hypothetical protein XBFM1_2230033 [Xenorhabdus bovienii str. feltiae Moldova]|uniref:Uncharacterized protein n=1 Tax=Xenorhabdus bovienii str. feltiae Moldova TaxID=1398200 RepID=A0A077NHP0_XENBV|nr:hypothetical protein XBFM1_2230033 [Xenorhabdus bovienii str. feltiae Moldova]
MALIIINVATTLEKHYSLLMKGYLKFLHLMSGSVGFKEKPRIKLLVTIQM